ncbi:hypothetical protein PPACK8108_LOCUS8109 [Phakopsora pachyrhizi]|uniref:Uncharacterized protein n=1 Tax=Phakopsora pachyrhizi TaxID=170000 RepID=A0AAV0AU36_PHAPC|nr:hypothetical protein PPACK8108_LOCUS8109 [Phakopsora pachyrhizi]
MAGPKLLKLDFLQVFQSISLSLEGQITEVATSPVFIHLQKKISQFALLKLQQQHDLMTQSNQEPCSGKFWRIWGIPCCHMIEEKINKFNSMEAPFKLSDVHHQWHLIVPSAMEKKTEDLNTEELAEKEFENFGSFFKQHPAFRRRELIGDLYKMCNGYYRLEPAGVTSVVPNPRGRPAIQFPGATKTLTKRDMSRFEVEDAIAAHKKHWEELERQKSKKAPLPSVPIVNPGASKSYNLRTRSQNPPNPIPNSPFHTRESSTRSSSFDGSFSNDRSYHPSPRSSSSLLDELRSENFQKIKDSPSKPHQELKDLYQSPYLKDGLITSPSYQTRGKKEEEQDQKSKFGVERTSVKNLYQSPVVKDYLSKYAASSSKEDIARLENLRKEHEKASKLKEEAAEKLQVLRSLKKEAEDDLFDLISRKTSMSRRTSVVGSPLPTRMPSISAGSTTDKRKISPTSYETVTQGSSIKPRTKHEELMRYIPQPLQ